MELPTEKFIGSVSIDPWYMITGGRVSYALIYKKLIKNSEIDVYTVIESHLEWVCWIKRCLSPYIRRAADKRDNATKHQDRWKARSETNTPSLALGMMWRGQKHLLNMANLVRCREVEQTSKRQTNGYATIVHWTCCWNKKELAILQSEGQNSKYITCISDFKHVVYGVHAWRQIKTSFACGDAQHFFACAPEQQKEAESELKLQGTINS